MHNIIQKYKNFKEKEKHFVYYSKNYVWTISLFNVSFGNNLSFGKSKCLSYY